MSLSWPRSGLVLVLVMGVTQGLEATGEVPGGESSSARRDSASLSPEAGVELRGDLSPTLAAEVLLRANNAYQEGAYSRASAGYQRLLRAGFDDGRIHYNLGNALLRSGELGKAVASYLRSRARRPRDEDVRANLAFARQSTKDAIEPPDPSEVLSTLFFWHFRLSHRELAIGLTVVNLIFWAVLCSGLLWPGRELVRWASIVLAALLLTLVASLLVHRFVDRPVAVIVPPEVTVHTAPEESSVVRFKLHAGTELRVEDRRQSWVRVSLPDGQQGWVDEGWVELVYR